MTDFLTDDVKFRPDNTDGYSPEELEQFNAELADRLTGVEQCSPDWYQIASEFSDEVNNRV